MRERRPERCMAIVGDSERARVSENEWGGRAIMGEVYYGYALKDWLSCFLVKLIVRVLFVLVEGMLERRGLVSLLPSIANGVCPFCLVESLLRRRGLVAHFLKWLQVYCFLV